MGRIGLTSSPDRIDGASGRIVELGHEPVVLPCISALPLAPEVTEEIRRVATSVDIVLIASPRAVAAVWGDVVMPDTPVIAVGESSAAAVRSRGGNISVVGTSDLPTLLDAVELSGRSVLYPCSSLTDRPSRETAISGAGGKPFLMVAYEVVPVAPADDQVDVVVFASPSAVEGWTSSRTLEEIDTVAIGPTTESRLVGLGFPPSVVSDRPDLIRCAELAVEFI